jgi:hypothetical protein
VAREASNDRRGSATGGGAHPRWFGLRGRLATRQVRAFTPGLWLGPVAGPYHRLSGCIREHRGPRNKEKRVWSRIETRMGSIPEAASATTLSTTPNSGQTGPAGETGVDGRQRDRPKTIVAAAHRRQFRAAGGRPLARLSESHTYLEAMRKPKSFRPPAALIREAASLIRPVRLPVFRFGKKSSNPQNYLCFVVQRSRKIRLKSRVSLFFSLLAGSAPVARPVSKDCAHRHVFM